MHHICAKATELDPAKRYADLREILAKLDGEATKEKLWRKAADFWASIRLPNLSRTKVDAKMVQEVIAEKLSTYRPTLPNVKEDFPFHTDKYSLAPLPHPTGEGEYLYETREDAAQSGLQAFAEHTYPLGVDCIKQFMILYRQDRLKNFYTYEISKNIVNAEIKST